MCEAEHHIGLMITLLVHRAAELLMDERDTWRTPYYKRALETDDYIFIAPPDGQLRSNHSAHISFR